VKHRKITTKNGIYIEISWHRGRWQYMAEWFPKEPDGKWGMVFADSRKELIGKLRLDIVEYLNPRIKAVRLRLAGLEGKL
jgi:hypothetical protein